MNDEAPKLFYEQMGLINAMNYLTQKKKMSFPLDTVL